MQISCVILNFHYFLLFSFLCYEFGFVAYTSGIFISLIFCHCIYWCWGSACGGWFFPLYLMTMFEIQISYFKVKSFLVSVARRTKNSPSIFACALLIFTQQVPFCHKNSSAAVPLSQVVPHGGLCKARSNFSTRPCLSRKDPAKLPEQHQSLLRIQVRISLLVS